MDEDKKKLDDEIESMIGDSKPDEDTSERVRRPDKQRPIRDIAHLNDSFYKFISKQLLIIIASKFFKQDPKAFINNIIEHFMGGYKGIILRRHELKEGTDGRMGDIEENQLLFRKLAAQEKQNELDDLERYGETMRQQIMDLVEDDEFDEFGKFDNPDDPEYDGPEL